MALEYSRQIPEKCSNIKSYQNLLSGSPFVPRGRTDMTKQIVAYRNFANASKNKQLTTASRLDASYTQDVTNSVRTDFPWEADSRWVSRKHRMFIKIFAKTCSSSVQSFIKPTTVLSFCQHLYPPDVSTCKVSPLKFCMHFLSLQHLQNSSSLLHPSPSPLHVLYY